MKAEDVAASLSEAQRRTITTFRPDWVCSWNSQGHDALVRKGLVAHLTGNCGHLTLLGLAVRSHLLKERGE